MKQQFLYWCKKMLTRSKASVALVLALSIITVNGQFAFNVSAQEVAAPIEPLTTTIVEPIMSVTASTNDSPITLPTSQALLMSVAENHFTTEWSFDSGPGPTPTIETPDTAYTTVTGLTVAGIYTFKITAYNFGETQSVDATVQVEVLAAEGEGNGGGEEEEGEATISATKIVCDSESYLPNWGEDDDNPTVTATTAAEFLAEGDNDEHCHLQEGWKFEWAPDGTENPGDNIIGAAGGDWTETSSTDGNGMVTFEVPAGDDLVWVREQMQPGYYDFTGPNTEDDVSAELHCNTDSVNYDNVEWVSPRVEGETYHCVAFNVQKKATVSATKIVCDSEADLPNWGLDDDNGIVTETTASEFLATHLNCHVQEGWKFEWAPEGTSNPGDNTEAVGGAWTETGVTAVDGTVSFTVPVGTGLVWVREQLKDGYIPFTGNNTDQTVSAELHCNTDSFNYDNFEWLATLEDGKTYHCVAFNAPAESGEQCIPEPNGSWADGVVSSEQGKRKDGSDVPAARSNPNDALGASDWISGGSTGFYTLGFGGSIVLSFDSYVPDVAGTDLVVHEATNGTYPLETATVEVSQNGTDWELAGTADNTTPTKITNIDFSSTGLAWFKFVKITDTSDKALFSQADADGFDLDAVKVTEQVCEEPEGEEQGKDTEETIVVKPSDMNEWAFFQETATGSGSMVFGAGIPPLGDGSAQFIVNDTGGEALGTLSFAGTLFEDITSLTYKTYRVSGGSALAPALQFEFDNDLIDANTTYRGRLVYEPYHTQTVSTGTWETWDALNDGAGTGTGSWWGTPNGDSTLDELCPQSNPCTWAEVMAAFPDGGIRSAGPLTGVTLFKAGGGWAGGFTGNVDQFVIGVQTGLNTHTTTFDFEPTPTVCSDGLDNDNDGLTDAADPGCHTDGNATNSQTYDINDNNEANPALSVTINDEEENTDDNTSNITQRSGSSGSMSFGSFTPPPAPQVLGESTSVYCEEYLKSYIEIGAKNDPEEVKKLQAFLNEHLGLNLTVDGVYGKDSYEAVKAFQTKYLNDVLTPWVKIGRKGVADGTGYVYKTTKRWINLLMCPDLNLPIPDLP